MQNEDLHINGFKEQFGKEVFDTSQILLDVDEDNEGMLSDYIASIDD